MISPSYSYRARVARVIDADTLELDVDLGFHVTKRITCRLYGIDAYELRGPERARGLSARQFVIHWTATHCRDGWLLVNTIQDRQGKYGRWLAEIVGRNRQGHIVRLADSLLAAGHLKPPRMKL